MFLNLHPTGVWKSCCWKCLGSWHATYSNLYFYLHTGIVFSFPFLTKLSTLELYSSICLRWSFDYRRSSVEKQGDIGPFNKFNVSEKRKSMTIFSSKGDKNWQIYLLIINWEKCQAVDQNVRQSQNNFPKECEPKFIHAMLPSKVWPWEWGDHGIPNPLRSDGLAVN